VRVARARRQDYFGTDAGTTRTKYELHVEQHDLLTSRGFDKMKTDKVYAAHGDKVTTAA
jgi:hypothetical protein